MDHWSFLPVPLMDALQEAGQGQHALHGPGDPRPGGDPHKGGPAPFREHDIQVITGQKHSVLFNEITLICIREDVPHSESMLSRYLLDRKILCF